MSTIDNKTDFIQNNSGDDFDYKENSKPSLRVFDINQELANIYNKRYVHGIKSLFSIFDENICDDNIFIKFKESLNLPERRIIGDKIFIKTTKITMEDGIFLKNYFYIVLNKDGKPLPSYDSEFVEILPDYGLICGYFKNNTISKATMEIEYIVGFSELDLDMNIANGYTLYKLPINNYINKVYEEGNYTEKDSFGRNINYKTKEIAGGIPVIPVIDKDDRDRLIEKHNEERQKQITDRNKYGNKKKTIVYIHESELEDGVIDIFTLASNFMWDLPIGIYNTNNE